jgi:hypothetical protein
MRTITSANSSLALAVVPVFPAPQLIQGYATDDAFTSEAQEQVETLMGVDGNLSAGFVFNPVKLTLALQADSLSNDLFEAWRAYHLLTKEVAVASATLIIPGIKKKYVFSKGFLTSMAPAPDGKKILQPRHYQITWERVIGMPN